MVWLGKIDSLNFKFDKGQFKVMLTAELFKAQFKNRKNWVALHVLKLRGEKKKITGASTKPHTKETFTKEEWYW